MLVHRSAGLVPRSRAGRSMVGTGVLLVALAGTTVLSGGGTAAIASSHREAPLIAGNPEADDTDTYVFNDPNDATMVDFVSNWIPFEEPNGGPNFYPFAAGAHYDINIDNDGDGHPDITYQWTFKDNLLDTNLSATDAKTAPFADTFLYNTGPVTNLATDTMPGGTLNFYQTYNLDKITYAKPATAGTPEVQSGDTTLLTNVIAAPSDTGKASMPNYGALRSQATYSLGSGAGQTYAGQADDSFFLDLRIFDLLYGAAPTLPETGADTLAGYNVNTIALQVPKSAVALNGKAVDASGAPYNPVIGTWSTTKEQSSDIASGTPNTGAMFEQVSRLGNPLVNEAVVPRSDKDAFNTLEPYQDAGADNGRVAAYVLSPTVPKVIQALYGINAPATPRNDLAEIFLTGLASNAPSIGGPGGTPIIAADLNSQLLNADVKSEETSTFTPAEEERLNLTTPVTSPTSASYSDLGVINGDFGGFPNGRRLTDDVVDIEIQALEGGESHATLVAALATGDKVNANDVPFSTTFPYVALPHSASVNGRDAAVAATTAPVTTTSSSAPATTTTSGAAGTGATTTTTTTTNTTPVGGAATGGGGLATVARTTSSTNESTLAIIAGAVGIALVGVGGLTLRRSRRSASQS